MLPPVVDAAWLAAHPEAVVADARWYLDGRSAQAAYDGGHIPGAIRVDLHTDLARHGDPIEGRHPLPAPEAFARAMAGLGIGEDDVVVAYDDAGGTVAARLVWMLRVTGHAAALLDGGLAAYAGPLETARATRPPATFTARPWPAGLLADADRAGAAGRDEAAVLLDARDGDRYRGETEPVDPRAGHIPGARSLPTRGHLGPDGRFLDPAALRERFAAVGADGRAVVAYCGSGVTACHQLIALELAGLAPGALYDGSWSAWSNDPDRPAATGDTP
jgi:thiosulfate/3-mercaptopyruvate sulfurtransferase